MQLDHLLSPERIATDVDVQSKKRALEQVSELLATGADALSTHTIFESLIGRERLGSTGLGAGIAIPHGRVTGCTTATGALIRLATPVDYDAMDGQPVDLIFALLVPEESTDEHLQILSELARRFSEEHLAEKLRACADGDAALELLH